MTCNCIVPYILVEEIIFISCVVSISSSKLVCDFRDLQKFCI